MLEKTTRTLTDPERRALRMRVASLRAAARSFGLRLIVSSAGLCGAMAILTILASDVSSSTVLVFWSVIGLLISVWVWVEDSRRRRTRVRAFESALRHAEVREVRIQAAAVVEFEEEEDEGATYAFDLGDGTTLFIAGQEFYPSRNFPNTDFSLVQVYDEEGTLVESYLEKHGQRLRPVRTVPVHAKRRLRIPEHLERIEATLSDLERVLAA